MVKNALSKTNVDPKTQTNIDIAVEEIFVNISSYAYPDCDGKVSVCLFAESNSITIEFKDNGIPYNPLAKADPDVSLPAEQREIGGLGIFMVKNLMDEMSYEYRNGQNILTIKKSWNDG